MKIIGKRRNTDKSGNFSVLPYAKEPVRKTKMDKINITFFSLIFWEG